MSTELLQIILWTIGFIVLRVVCSGLNLRSLKPDEVIRVKKRMVWVDAVRLFCLWVVLLYASPYRDYLTEHLSGLWNIGAIAITLIPKRLWRYLAIDTLED